MAWATLVAHFSPGPRRKRPHDCRHTNGVSMGQTESGYSTVFSEHMPHSRVSAHLAALWATADASRTNPLWQPQWPPGAPADAATADTWGEGPEAALLAGIVGSNLCLDRFGSSHPGEVPRPLHGEAGVAEWVIAKPDPSSSPVAVCFEAYLPLAGLQVRRSFALTGASVTVTTAVLRPSASPDAPVEWAEHTTLGGPFLDGVAAVEATVNGAWDMPAGGAAAAAAGAGEDAPPSSVPLAAALRMPGPADPPEGSVRTTRVSPGSPEGGRWRAASPATGWVLEAAWDAADFPWLCVWTEHRSRSHAPWAGRERTRGLELSTKPFPEGRPPPSRQGEFAGAPASFAVAAGAPAVSKAVTLTWTRL